MDERTRYRIAIEKGYMVVASLREGESAGRET